MICADVRHTLMTQTHTPEMKWARCPRDQFNVHTHDCALHTQFITTKLAVPIQAAFVQHTIDQPAASLHVLPYLPHKVYSCCFNLNSFMTSLCWLAMSTYFPGKLLRCSRSSGFRSLNFVAGLPAQTCMHVYV